MKAASLSDIKKELTTKPPKEVYELCLNLAKFSKENKELLTYLIYEKENEAKYIIDSFGKYIYIACKSNS